MVTTALLTPARRHALEVLAATHPRPGRYSNETKTGSDTRIALVHWQAADWLIEEGLVALSATRSLYLSDAGLCLTAAGLIACAAAGIKAAMKQRREVTRSSRSTSRRRCSSGSRLRRRSWRSPWVRT